MGAEFSFFSPFIIILFSPFNFNRLGGWNILFVQCSLKDRNSNTDTNFRPVHMFCEGFDEYNILLFPDEFPRPDIFQFTAWNHTQVNTK
jgi:hypothetical protein